MPKKCSPIRPDEFLDLSGVGCPQNSARALLRLETMMAGEILELLIDDGEPKENVPPSLTEEGHEILEMQKTATGWKLLIKNGGD